MAALDLTGKTAIVTGASSGIGQATARALKDAGVRVAGGARRVDRLETDVQLELDVTDQESSERFVSAAGGPCNSSRSRSITRWSSFIPRARPACRSASCMAPAERSSNIRKSIFSIPT